MSTGIFISVGVILVLAIGAFLASMYKKVTVGSRVIIARRFNGKRDVSTTGLVVVPFFHSYEYLDMAIKSIPFERSSKIAKTEQGGAYDSLYAKDNIKVDLRVCFYLNINPTPEAIIQVVEKHGAENAGSAEYLRKHFGPKFSEALKTAVKKFDYQDLHTKRIEFREEVKKGLSEDLGAFQLNDVVIDDLQQSPLEAHDKNNVLDAEGLKIITKRTAEMNVETAEIRQAEQTNIKKKEVEGDNARLELNRQLEEQKSKTDREIQFVKLEELSKVKQKEQEERLKQETARIETEQKIAVNLENNTREIEVTKINNEKVLGVSREEVERTKKVEVVKTEQEVLTRKLDNEILVEEKRKGVAEIQATRTKVERGIAVEEEETKNIKIIQESNRKKIELVVAAEAKSEAEMIAKVKTAEAEKMATIQKAESDNVKADADLKVAAKQAEAKELNAKATRVEQAAIGLAEAEVKVAMADATEKEGLAEASRVNAVGEAQANATKANYEAMSAISIETREHEINKLNLENARTIRIADIEANKEVAKANAQVMAAAMGKADIKVFGDGDIFDRIKNSTAFGHSLDATFKNSDILNTEINKYQSGESNLIEDIKTVLSKGEVSTGSVGNLAIASTFAKLINENGGIEGLLKLLQKK